MPVSSPRPRVLVGGGGERKTLRLAAQYADAWNMFAMDAAEVAPKLDVLRRHCEALDRPFDLIEKSVLGPPVLPVGQSAPYSMTPAQGIELFGRLSDLGIDQYIAFTSIETPAVVDALAGEIMPHFVDRTTRI
jgi:hypothetical protein